MCARPSSPEEVFRLVETTMHVTAAEWRGPDRYPHIMDARRAIVWLLRRHTYLSFPEIAAAMNNRSHSTPRSRLKRAETAYERQTPLGVTLREMDIMLRDHR